jgi:histone H3/H4
MGKLHFATFERILKESKKGIRVSDRATDEFMAAIGEISKQLAADSVELAEHANRKTILEQDVRLAYRKMRGSPAK